MNTHGLNEAAINEIARDSTVRVLTNAFAYALTAVTPRVLRRTLVATTTTAQVGVVGRLLQRVAFATTAAAEIYNTARAKVFESVGIVAQVQLAIVKPALQVRLSASAAAQMLIVSRLKVTATTTGEARADIYSRGSVLSSAPVEFSTIAQVENTPRALIRSSVLSQPRVGIDTRTGVVKRVQFDEYAVEAQTYVVGFENNIFYVR